MHIHDMTEEAYKNGYEAGIKKFAERLKEHFKMCDAIYNQTIYSLEKELIEHR